MERAIAPGTFRRLADFVVVDESIGSYAQTRVRVNKIVHSRIDRMQVYCDLRIV